MEVKVRLRISKLLSSFHIQKTHALTYGLRNLIHPMYTPVAAGHCSFSNWRDENDPNLDVLPHFFIVRKVESKRESQMYISFSRFTSF